MSNPTKQQIAAMEKQTIVIQQPGWQFIARHSTGAAAAIGVDGIDSNLKLNKALWHLAEVLKNGAQPADAADFHKFAVANN